MLSLNEKIRAAIANGQYVFSVHADERLRDRRIVSWQIVGGVEEGKLLVERPADLPNPVIELEQHLPDGTAIKAVWAWIEDERIAKLVTIHFFDR